MLETESKYLEPTEFYHKEGDRDSPIIYAQSVKKFKDDCLRIGGNWIGTHSITNYHDSRCLINNVTDVITEDKHSGRENFYGYTQIIAKSEDPYNNKGMLIVGLSGIGSSGRGVMLYKGKIDAKKAMIFKEDWDRINIKTSDSPLVRGALLTPEELKVVYESSLDIAIKSILSGTSWASSLISFPNPIKCLITAHSEDNTSGLPPNLYKSWDVKNPLLTPIREVRTDCYLGSMKRK